MLQIIEIGIYISVLASRTPLCYFVDTQTLKNYLLGHPTGS